VVSVVKNVIFALVAISALLPLASAGGGDCPAGYRFERMSGVGCVQDKCRDVPHAFYNYVGYCVCYSCGEVGCSGDKEFSKECKRAADYASCPNCLYSCINPGDKCPQEQTTKPPAQPTTTMKTPASSTTLGQKNGNSSVKGRLTAFGRPLKHVRISCDGKDVFTDAEGNYALDAGVKDCEFNLEYVRDGKTYFVIHHQDNNDPITYSHTFKVGESGDLSLDELFEESYPGSEAYVSAYVHMSEALDFYEALGEKFPDTLHVRLFMPDDPDQPKAYYKGGEIVFQERASVQDAPGRQVMFYHEFSHYMMESLYGRFPQTEGKGPVKWSNHGGFLNPSSSDSYVEGFAAFMSVVMAEAYGQTVPGKDYSQMSLTQLLIEAGKAPITDLETDYTAWERQGRLEEYAVAGVLWDLVDGEEYYRKMIPPEEAYQNYLKWKKETEEFNEYTKREYPGSELVEIPEYDRAYFENLKRDDDSVEIEAEDVWKVIRSYRGDVSEVYDALNERFPGSKAGIDDVFARHGFFADTRKGNGRHDEYEPYQDKNKNGRYDDGEYYVDYSGEKPEYVRGMAVGSASNYQRPWRKTTQEIQGQYIRTNNEVPYYDVAVVFPTKPHLTYAYRTTNENGRIYLNIPPSGYDATLIIRAEGAKTGRPLSISAEKFNRNYGEYSKRGYIQTHDFRITGPIPQKAPTPKGPAKREDGPCRLPILTGIIAMATAAIEKKIM
jgi:hypothetical protein